MKKKLIITISIILAVLLLITAVVFGIKAFSNKNLVATVESVGMLNYGYWGDTLESEGIVVNNAYQSIYPEDGQIVNEVFVKEGQQVSKGDRLMSFDITSLELSAEIKKLEVQSQQNQYDTAIKKLNQLKNTKPVSRQPVISEPEEVVTQEPDITEAPVEETKQPLPDMKNDDLYNYINAGFEPDEKTPAEEDKKEVWKYFCAEEVFVLGGFLNEIAGTDRAYTFQIMDGEESMAALSVSGKWFSGDYDEEMRWYPFDPASGYFGDEALEDGDSDEENSDEEDFDADMHDEPDISPEDEIEEGYTAAELAAAIRETEAEIRKLDLSIRTEKLQLAMIEQELKDGVVYARIDGVVKTVGDPSDPPVDGSAFLTVSGSEGLYVKGVISELKREQISVGQSVQCMDYESGNMITAVISAIDDYPTEDLYFYGERNPNSSTYGYTAYVEDASLLTGGQYLELMIETQDSEEGSVAIYLEKGFIRTENGKSYVLKDEDGYLMKQYVTTGKTIWGSAVEITSGLSEEDYIAFPYGPEAKEGVKTSLAD